MFGYIKAYQPELRVKDAEIYKAVYCTLCRSLGKHYGLFARFTLSYDFTFMALAGLSVGESCPGYKQRRCAFNPFVKCQCCKDEQTVFSYVSACAMVLLYYKLMDNIADTRGIKKMAYRLLKPISGHAMKKASRAYPELAGIMEKYISAQHKLEAEGCQSLDGAAQPSADMLAGLFEIMGTNESNSRALKHLGYLVGKWVYLADAADDIEDDHKRGNYNVLLAGCNNGNLPDIINERRECALVIMRMCIEEAGKTLALLDCMRYEELLNNIIYWGMPAVSQELCTGAGNKAKGKKKK